MEVLTVDVLKSLLWTAWGIMMVYWLFFLILSQFEWNSKDEECRVIALVCSLMGLFFITLEIVL